MKVSDIMCESVITVEQNESVATAARVLKRNNLGALPVCDESGRLRGVVTDRDIVLRCVALDSDPQTTPVKEIMSRGVATISKGESVEKLSETMIREQVRRLPVTDNGRLVGMATLGDLARQADCGMEAGETLRRLSTNLRFR